MPWLGCGMGLLAFISLLRIRPLAPYVNQKGVVERDFTKKKVTMYSSLIGHRETHDTYL